MRGPLLLPQLRNLEIHSIPPIHHSLLLIRRPFQQLTTLKVDNIHFSSLLDFQRLLDKFFPHVTSLILDEVQFMSAHSSRFAFSRKNLPHSDMPSIVHLELPESADIVRWILLTKPTFSLRNVATHAEHLPLFESCGKNIEDLDVCYYDVPDVDDNISIGSHIFPSLKRLTLCLEPSDVPSFRTILLRHPPSSCLTGIRFHFPNIQKSHRHCSLFDETLVHTSLSNLQEVKVSSKHSECFPKNTNYIAAANYLEWEYIERSLPVNMDIPTVNVLHKFFVYQQL
ncbi:hypothetical protein ABKN59_009192 [Abortiporus biennis]